MPYIVLVAELLAAGWLLFFTGLVVSLVMSGRGLPEGRNDAVGRTLLRSARLGLTIGVPTLALAETAYVAGWLG